MNKREIVEHITKKLKITGMIKPITIPRHTFTISDKDGNDCEFHVRRVDKSVNYTQDDVVAIMDAFVTTAEDILRIGGKMELRGFGVLEPHYRAARKTKDPYYGKECEVEARYVPKFTPGKSLKLAVKLWELDQKDGG